MQWCVEFFREKHCQVIIQKKKKKWFILQSKLYKNEWIYLMKIIIHNFNYFYLALKNKKKLLLFIGNVQYITHLCKQSSSSSSSGKEQNNLFLFQVAMIMSFVFLLYLYYAILYAKPLFYKSLSMCIKIITVCRLFT